MNLKVPVAVAFILVAGSAGADQKLDQAVAKALDQITKGKTDDALRNMQKFAEQNPTSVEAQLALASIQERVGNVEDAAATAARAASAAADPALKAEALATLAGYDLLRGSSKDALAHANDAVKAQAGSAAAQAALARAHARVGDGANALAAADKAVAAAATSAVAHEARGEALLTQGKHDDAAAAFRKALELDPKLTRARVGLARGLIGANKAAEAVTEARKATEENAKSGEAFAALGLALLAQNPQANWSDAIAQAQQGAFLNPKSPYVNIAVGKIFDAAGNVDQSSAAYKRALEADPGNTQARLALIQAQQRKGDNAAALKEIEAVAKEMPNNGEVQLMLGKAYLLTADYANAVAPLEKAVAAAPGVAEGHAMLGTAYQFNRKTEEAAAAYKKAIELSPNNPDYLTTHGLLQGLTGQYDAAIAALTKVTSNPAYKGADAWINLGWVYRNMDPPKLNESVAAYKKALEINPKSEQSALGMGWAYSYLKNWDESIKAFEKAIAIDPKTAGEAYNGMAWAFFFKRDLPKAEEFVEKAKTAGRNVASLLENIERRKKIQASPATGGDTSRQDAEELAEYERQRKVAAKVESLNRDMRGGPSARCRALGDMGGVLGAGDALSYLINSLRQDPSVSVRECAVNAIKALGCSAKSALPHVKYTSTAQGIECLQCTKEELQEMAKQEDLKRAARETSARLEACRWARARFRARGARTRGTRPR
jgi:tetratricopeptide (TPR) repeat protein